MTDQLPLPEPDPKAEQEWQRWLRSMLTGRTVTSLPWSASRTLKGRA